MPEGEQFDCSPSFFFYLKRKCRSARLRRGQFPLYNLMKDIESAGQ